MVSGLCHVRIDPSVYTVDQQALGPKRWWPNSQPLLVNTIFHISIPGSPSYSFWPKSGGAVKAATFPKYATVLLQIKRGMKGYFCDA